MTTKAHEVAHRHLDKFIFEKLIRMNNHDKIFLYGEAQIESGSVKKKPDTSYGPVSLPAVHTDKWPTVAIVKGYTESKAKLACDARWWLIETGGDVKTVLMVFVHQRKREIIIERWRMIDRPMRKQEGKKVAEVVQKVVISQVKDQVVHSIGRWNHQTTVVVKFDLVVIWKLWVLWSETEDHLCVSIVTGVVPLCMEREYQMDELRGKV
ncbi:uncharacterized protein PGRI_015340 [Penicillium griseofulvum]|uniref:Uncharacterized protein n=1 Tax=Penicillium patulum TaxID=5078 RepID=A0A135LFE2_PENPA|nr:uncharacterized protein PGRI_015340 [Penicillium griseofulvum]KXG47664.1 hypothetical protein PGRI_015340 [Penicillium griseofulvum]